MGDDRRHVHLDLVGGLAGDMFLAAAIDAGVVSSEQLQSVLRTFGLGPVEVITEKNIRGAIEGTRLQFRGWDQSAQSDHRHLSAIREMLQNSELSDPVTRRAIEMFERLGEAEAAIHGVELDAVHFHEVGAVDSILDFVGAAWVIEHLDATWSVGPIPAGSGTIETAHGTIPVPAPATLRVLEGFEIRHRDVEAELVTPTGATIAATVAELTGERRGRVAATGFGCGSRDVEGISNVVRLTMLQRDQTQLDADTDSLAGAKIEQVVQLITEIDDQSPEIIAHVADELMDAGALDVVTESVHMKKGRDGVRLSVLCGVEDERRLADRIFEETTTLGIRRLPVQRWVLERTVEPVSTQYGQVDVKIARRGDATPKISPEYESCRRRAEEYSIPIREVFEEARTKARRTFVDTAGDE